MGASRTAASLTGVLAGVMLPAAAAAQGTTPQAPTTSGPSAHAPSAPAKTPPTIECSLGFAALKTAALALPGAQQSEVGGFEMVTQALPETWRVEIFFTTRWHPAYPAVAIRTLRKQVTGVWTADSKACGYGNDAQFAALVDDMRASDKALTQASRAEAARKQRERSPLAPGP